MTPEQKRNRRLAKAKRYRRRYASELREQNRKYYHGTHRDWWKNACLKAGVSILELEKQS